MPVTTALRTPGVYITEEDAFPPSIVGVQTAVPAFIGYTEKANIAGKPIYLKPQKIKSFAEYVEIFGKGFQPDFNIVPVPDTDVQANPDAFDVSFVDAAGTTLYYAFNQKSDSRFNLYAGMKLFYDNGGEQCYVTSVGDYTNQGATPAGVAIDGGKLTDGLTAVGEVVGPTMLVIPDAVLLAPDNEPWESAAFYALAVAMLDQCAQQQDRVAILDVYGTQALNQDDTASFTNNFDSTIGAFRDGVANANLSYGMAYFPFLKTSTFPLSDINYTYFDNAELVAMLKLQSAALYEDQTLTNVDAMIDETTNSLSAEKMQELEGNLRSALPVLRDLERQIALDLGVLPPSAGMAGVFTEIDSTRGVWNAPANIAMRSVIEPTVRVNNELQADLNVPLNGKAIDVIRQFPGRGNVVWGARTLLGNSNDWRYIQVRRTIIYIEQSIQEAMMPFVFAANDGKTWSTVVSAVSNFLQRTWSQGGLMGATPAEAYTVECGLGSTMTAQDILEGYMIVQVQLQLLRPAEFIVLTFKQRMLEA